MQFQSTRGSGPAVGFSAALTRGLAADGGLFMPSRWPVLGVDAFAGQSSLSEVGATLIGAFAQAEPIAAEIPAIVREAFDFPAPLVPLGDTGLSVLELFHGPTAAFKDFGARFLAATLSRLRIDAARPLNILVATSGDTGGAVAAAFHNRPRMAVAVLFPKGLVSPTQERQLTCWGGNVSSYRVSGTFDDCQRLVKEAFVDTQLSQRFDFSSANSINLGRLLPQAVYYAATSLAVWRKEGRTASFIIPSGNLGNAAACLFARQLGLPIGDIVLAHNANSTVPQFLASGEWRPRPSIATLASAMDVGAPSNMERIRAMFPVIEHLRGAVRADSVSDEQIRARIRAGRVQFDQTWCPHTATAAELYARLPAVERAGKHWILVATAHPAKFREIVEPLLGESVPMPDTLARLFERPTACVDIAAEFAALRTVLMH